MLERCCAIELGRDDTAASAAPCHARPFRRSSREGPLCVMVVLLGAVLTASLSRVRERGTHEIADVVVREPVEDVLALSAALDDALRVEQP